jgi:alkylated DNA repair protein alkB family protein 1
MVGLCCILHDFSDWHKGVPRILENTLPNHLAAQPDEPQWAPFAEYMETTRININVRQVFPKGFDPVQIGR